MNDKFIQNSALINLKHHPADTDKVYFTERVKRQVIHIWKNRRFNKIPSFAFVLRD